MLMVAGAMRAILMTRHVPLHLVSQHLKPAVFEQSAALGYEFIKKNLGKTSPRIVACGLNPHAGDGGLIGSEEVDLFRPALRRLRQRGVRILGPVPADTAFRDMAAGHYDLALAAYHDQGMIALKVAAPDQLVNITLGLPYVRTSPGHGTAYDIAGKNKANPKPMIEAIFLAARYHR
jgi:4-hydroxy-L-threonine phosphate dehydrogenase PdxA